MEEAQGIDCLGRHTSINAERLVSEVACVHILRWERPSHWTRELEFSQADCAVSGACTSTSGVCAPVSGKPMWVATHPPLLIVVHGSCMQRSHSINVSSGDVATRAATKMTTQETQQQSRQHAVLGNRDHRVMERGLGAHRLQNNKYKDTATASPRNKPEMSRLRSSEESVPRSGSTVTLLPPTHRQKQKIIADANGPEVHDKNKCVSGSNPHACAQTAVRTMMLVR